MDQARGLIIRNGSDRRVNGVSLDMKSGMPFVSIFLEPGEHFATSVELAAFVEPQNALLEYEAPGVVQIYCIHAVKEGKAIILNLQSPLPEPQQEQSASDDYCLWHLA